MQDALDKGINSSNELPRVAIVILNWNGRTFLEKFLPYVIKSTYRNFEVIVADNASTDDSIPFLLSNYPRFPSLKIRLMKVLQKDIIQH